MVKNNTLQFIIIVYVFVTTNIEISICIPSLIVITKDFQCTESISKLILSINYISLGIVSLIIGGISDQIGRKKLMIIGTIIFTLSSFICYISPSISFLILGRLLQGIGAAIPIVLSGAIIFDIFGKNNSTKYFAITNAISTVCMAIAPIIGQNIIYNYGGWRNIFLLLTVLSAISLIFLVVLFKETKYNVQKIIYTNIIKEYKDLIKNTNFILSCISWTILASIIFFYLTNYLFLFIHYIEYPIYKTSEHQFYIMSCFFVFSMVSSIINNKKHITNILGWGCIFTGITLGLYLTIFNKLNYTNATLFMMIFASGNAILIAPLTTRSIFLSKGNEGKSMAMLNSIRLLIMFSVISLYSLLFNNNFFNMINIMLTMSLLSLIFQFLSYQKYN